MDRPDTPRARARRDTERRILELGIEHLATHGAAGLSLRAIARDMNVAASAVYRYVESRDELLTRLVVASYTDLADTVEAALPHETDSPPTTFITAIAAAMYDWAHQHPHQWALLYGSPVPDYAAPADRTTEPGTRVSLRLLDEVGRCTVRGQLPDLHPINDGLATVARSRTSTEHAFAGVLLWQNIIGAISVQIFGQWGPDTFSRPRDLITASVESLCNSLLK